MALYKCCIIIIIIIIEEFHPHLLAFWARHAATFPHTALCVPRVFPPIGDHPLAQPFSLQSYHSLLSVTLLLSSPAPSSGTHAPIACSSPPVPFLSFSLSSLSIRANSNSASLSNFLISNSSFFMFNYRSASLGNCNFCFAAASFSDARSIPATTSSSAPALSRSWRSLSELALHIWVC